MKPLNFLLILLVTLFTLNASSQSISAELSGMDSYTTFSGSVRADLTKNDKLSFTGATKYYNYYASDNRFILLSSLGYALTTHFSTTMGTLYAYGSAVKPTVGIQLSGTHNKINAAFAPSLAFSDQTEVLMRSSLQYSTSVGSKTDFVSKMSLLGFLNFHEHVSSRLSLRSGLAQGRFQYGLAMDIRFAGNEFEISPSVGAFVQCQLL